jgi:uncharacterized membrane protein
MPPARCHRIFPSFLAACLMLVPCFPPVTSSAPSEHIQKMAEPGQFMSIPLAFPEAEAQLDESGKYFIVGVEGTNGFCLLPGAPMLPFWGKMLSFPPGTSILGAEIAGSDSDEHLLSRKIMPAPEPVPNIFGAVAGPTYEGPAYAHNALFPEEPVSWSLATGMGEQGGIEAHLFVKVFPARYNPVTGQVVQLKKGTLNIEYSLPAPSPRRGNETYDILVLTPPEFESEMGRYEDQKESIGFTVKVVNLTAVYSNIYFNTSTGRDNQEKIKLFLAAAQLNWSVRYVVLTGDTDKFPTRAAYINDIDGTSTPSDLYYGDLFKNGDLTFCDWDKDRDNRFAESDSSSANQDVVDFDPDVAVGRFPASNEAELRGMLDKMEGYASNVSNDWFRNATLVGSDTFANCYPWYDTSGVAEGEYGCDKASTYIPLFNFSKFYETKGTFNAQNIKDCLNRGEGFALFADHGNVDGVVYPSSGGVGLNSPTASSLTNGPKLPLSILDACLTHAIDYSECLGEYLVLNPNGGSINSIGATRIGYGMFGAWHTYANSGYMMGHLMERFSNGTIMPGSMLDSTKRGYLADVGIWDYADVKTLVEYIQLGDPVTFIGGQGLGCSIENSSMWADPGASVSYHINVQNSALRSDHLNFSLLGCKWHYTLDTGPVTLMAKSSVNITLHADVDPLADAYETDNCTLVIVPTSTGLPIKLNITTGANCVRKVEFNTDRATFFACPGENISFNYSILNRGNIVESVQLNLWGGYQSAWMVKSTLAYRVIGPRSQADGRATFAVPQKCLAKTYFFWIATWTEGLSSKALPIEVTVKEVSGFELHALNDRAYAQVRALFDILVENTGNHPDACGLSIDDMPPGWSAVCPTQLGLEAYSNKTVNLGIMPGWHAIAGDYRFKLNLFSQKCMLLQTLNLTATVNRTSSLEFSCPDNYQAVDEGFDTSFELSFHSQSNFEEIISLAPSGLPAGWDWSMAPEEINLAPFSSVDTSFIFKVPSGTPAGIYIMALEASTTAWKKDLAVTVEVLEKRSFSAYLDRYQERLMPGEAGTFSLSLRNTGNCPDMYLLSAEGSLSILLSGNMLMLDPRSAATVAIDIGVPLMTPSGDYQVMLTVESARDPLVKKTMTIEIRVERISRLSLECEGCSETGQGMEGVFWLEVGNRGPETETVCLEAISPSWNAGCPAITVQPGTVRRVLVDYAVPDGLEGGNYDVSFIASSDLQSWNISHRVMVPASPPIQGHTIKVSNSSQSSLALILSAVVVLATLVATMALKKRWKKQNGKTS